MSLLNAGASEFIKKWVFDQDAASTWTGKDADWKKYLAPFKGEDGVKVKQGLAYGIPTALMLTSALAWYLLSSKSEEVNNEDENLEDDVDGDEDADDMIDEVEDRELLAREEAEAERLRIALEAEKAEKARLAALEAKKAEDARLAALEAEKAAKAKAEAEAKLAAEKAKVQAAVVTQPAYRRRHSMSADIAAARRAGL